MTISGKMMTGFTLVIIIMALANTYVLFELYSISEQGRSTLTSDVQVIDLAKYLKTILFDQERNGRKYLVAGDEVYHELLRDDFRRFSRKLDSLETIPHGPIEETLIVSIRDESSRIAEQILEYEDTLTPSDQTELGLALEASTTTMHEIIDRLVVLNQLSIDRSMAAVERKTERSEKVAYVMLLSALILALGAALLIASTITRPIRTLIRGTAEIAKGSFAPIEVRSRDEIAQLAGAVNEMAEKLKKMEDLRRDMMQHIAHELRTPLSTMMTAHYVLTQQRVGPLNGEQLRLLAAIRKNIDRLTDFSYDFLDLAKIEAGMMHYSLERTDLEELVKPLVEEARLNATQKGISVLYDSTDTRPVMIDPRRFSQVVTNLLSNAIKYTGSGGQIEVAVIPWDQGTSLVVRDNGPGIAPEDLSRVFEKFFRVRSADGKGSRGTGVGLALVKAVTEAMGGRVSAESELGGGSTFRVDLPAAHEELVSTLPDKPGKTIGHG